MTPGASAGGGLAAGVSLLARDLVGWDRLAAYDEVILANDSCYLLRPLDDVLAEMDARAEISRIFANVASSTYTPVCLPNTASRCAPTVVSTPPTVMGVS